MTELLDKDFDRLYDKDLGVMRSSGSSGAAGLTDYPSMINTYVRGSGLRAALYVDLVYNLYREIELFEGVEWPKFLELYVMVQQDSTTQLYDLISGNPLVSSGDHSTTYEGISGSGSFDFTGQINPSANITDFNNFSMGVWSSTDTDDPSDIDYGCTDSTNEVSIAIRDAGNSIVKAGTASVTTANTDGKAFIQMGVTDGQINHYINGSNEGTIALAGSAPNYVMTLGGQNDSGTTKKRSAKRYCLAYVYDGGLSDDLHFFLYGTFYKFILSKGIAL